MLSIIAASITYLTTVIKRLFLKLCPHKEQIACWTLFLRWWLTTRRHSRLLLPVSLLFRVFSLVVSLNKCDLRHGPFASVIKNSLYFKKTGLCRDTVWELRPYCKALSTRSHERKEICNSRELKGKTTGGCSQGGRWRFKVQRTSSACSVVQDRVCSHQLTCNTVWSLCEAGAFTPRAPCVIIATYENWVSIVRWM